jgi:hypothetical protein
MLQEAMRVLATVTAIVPPLLATHALIFMLLIKSRI